MKEYSILITIGIAIYAILTVVDKFLWHVGDVVYIIVASIAAIFIVVGFLKDRKNK